MSPARPLLANRYAVHQPLDCGAGAVRFVATDTTKNELVVVAVVGKEEARWRSAGKAVSHRHLAAVLEVFDRVDFDALPTATAIASSARVIVAELVRGPTLAMVLESGPLALDRSVAWFIRLAEALRALHARQALHGAVCSDAVVVQPSGRVIAPVLSQLMASPRLLYASPERLRGEGPSVADDLWALGVLLFESLTARPPFSGRNAAEYHRATSQSLASTGLESKPHGRELDVIIRRLLEPDRRRRFGSAEEVVELLDRWERRAALPTVVPVMTRPAASTTASQVPEPASWDHLLVERPAGAAIMLRVIEAAENERLLQLAQRPSITGSRPAFIAATDGPPSSEQPSGGDARLPSGGAKEHRPRSHSVSPDAFSARLRGARRWRFWLLGAIGAVVLAGGGVGVGLFLKGEERTSVGSSRNTGSVSSAVAEKPSAPKRTAREEQTRCIRAYFLADTFRTNPDLEFVCTSDEFVSVARELNELANLDRTDPVADAGAEPLASAETASTVLNPGLPSAVPSEALVPGAAPSVSPGLVVKSVVTPRSWQLGWYELLATAIIRQKCCKDVRPIHLPEPGGSCPKLPPIVTSAAVDSTKSGDISPAVRAFDEGVICLLDQGRHMVYPYRAVPTAGHKAAFQQFLKHSAETDARRSSGRY